MPTPSAAAPPAPDRLTATVAAALDRRLDRASGAPVAVAFSGGGDSLALLLTALEWGRGAGRDVVALIVDHRLHPDSPAWSAAAAGTARRAGAAARILAWAGPKPGAGLPAAARDARHRLLAEAAREAGAHVVLLGHTDDDAAEADLIREHDAPAIGRLREWSPSPAWPEGRGLFLLRPLLAQRRADLRDWLRGRGAGWFDDPANDDPRFARGRARARLGPRASAPPRPTMTAFGMTQWEATPDGRIRLPRQGLDARTLAAALLCAAGTGRPPRGAQLERLLEQLAGEARVDATLCGARVAAGDAVEIGRDAGERFRGGLAELALSAGREVVWDGRFVVDAEEPGLTLGPLGGAIARLAADERRALGPVPAWARGALPAIYRGPADVRLPRPFGSAPAVARSLAPSRLAAFCERIPDERALTAEAPGLAFGAPFRPG